MILFSEREVKDPEGQIILDAIATKFGYTGFSDKELLVAQTKQEFYEAWILKMTLSAVSEHLKSTAGDVAAKDKQAEIDTTIKLELEP